MDTKALANRVAAQHGTRDPFRIAEELGFIVIRAPLVEMRGLRQYVKRRTIVYVNASLDEPQQRLVCAHELGHALLHEGHNALFLRERTDFVMERYEREADLFAGYLLLDGETVEECLRNGWTSEQAAAFTGLPAHIVEYCMTH